MGFCWLEVATNTNLVASEPPEVPSSFDTLACRCEVRCRADTPALVGRCEMEPTTRYYIPKLLCSYSRWTASEFPQTLSPPSLHLSRLHHMIRRYGSRMECTQLHSPAPASLRSKASKREDDHTVSHASSRSVKSESSSVDRRTKVSSLRSIAY
jgi:hypothetical protein